MIARARDGSVTHGSSRRLRYDFGHEHRPPGAEGKGVRRQFADRRFGGGSGALERYVNDDLSAFNEELRESPTVGRRFAWGVAASDHQLRVRNVIGEKS